jgi:hypothetical protein
MRRLALDLRLEFDRDSTGVRHAGSRLLTRQRNAFEAVRVTRSQVQSPD